MVGDLPGPGLWVSGRNIKLGTGTLKSERRDGSLFFAFPPAGGVGKAPAPALNFMYLCETFTPDW